MNEFCYFDSFEQLKARYGIITGNEILTEDAGTSLYNYYYMNWGYDGTGNSDYYSIYPSDEWQYLNYERYKYDKKIYYDFR